jgi:hypothetical protein
MGERNSNGKKTQTKQKRKLEQWTSITFCQKYQFRK